jgi:cytochrome P450
MKEVLRMHPSAHVMSRYSLNEDEINGYRIKKNSSIYFLIANIHRHPVFWKNPNTFDPLRFKDHPFGQETPSAYIPFGIGEKSCIGRDFVFLEVLLIIPMLLQRFRFRLPPGTTVRSEITTPTANRPNISRVILQKKCGF